MESKEFPVAGRSMEYLAFSIYLIPTKEGKGYFYFAIDAYSGIVIHLGVDKDYKPETILKYIYLLTENSNFIDFIDKEFTIVLEEYKELSERIRVIIRGIGGKLIINKAFHNQIASPVLKSLEEYLIKGLNKHVD